MKKLTIKRTFDAPIEDVWEAFTSPELLAKWWAPSGMSNSFVSTEVKVGGMFRYCMKMDEGGQEFWGRGIYQKIDKPNFISYLDAFTDENGNAVAPSYYGMPGDDIIETILEITFVSDGDKTEMILVGDNPFDDDMTENMTKGWNDMFDKLTNNL